MDKSTGEIKALTSLRFIAALFVFFQHVQIYGRLGSVAVTFFFVLSGALLAMRYEGRLKNSEDWKSFYVLRVARLYPAHLVTLVAALGFALWTGYGVPSMDMFIQRMLLLQVYLPSGQRIFAFHGISWSVANEMFFYLCFPALLMVAIRIPAGRLPIVVVIIATIIVSGLIAYQIPGQVVPFSNAWWFLYAFPGYRILDFIAGMGVGLLLTRLRWRPDFLTSTALEMLSIALLAFSVLTVSWQRPALGYSPHFLPALCALVLSFSISRGAISKTLSLPVLVLLGELSYGFFLLHPLIMEAAQYASSGALWSPSSEIVWWTMRLAVFSITVALSLAMYRTIEQPAMRMARRSFARTPTTALRATQLQSRDATI